MAKRLNKNVVIGLAATGFMLTTAAGVFMVKYNQPNDPAEFVRRAESCDKSGDHERAAAYYWRAYRASLEAQQSAEAAKYQVRTGEMFLKMGEEAKAHRTFSDAVTIDPTLLDAHSQKLDIELQIAHMSQGPRSWSQVQESADAILALPDQEKHPQALYAKGAALLGLKDQDRTFEAKGLALLEEAVQLAPHRVPFVVELAQYYASQNRTEDEERLLNQLVALNKEPGEDAARAHCTYARFKSLHGDEPAAIGLYDQAVALAGNDPEDREYVHTTIGQYWSNRWFQMKQAEADTDEAAAATEEIEKAYTAAVDACRRAIKERPEGFDSYLTLAQLYSQNAEDSKAIDVLKERLDLPIERQGFRRGSNKAGQYIILLRLADQYTAQLAALERGTPEYEELAKKISDCVEQALQELPNGMEALHARGRLCYVQGKLREAVQSFEEAEQGRRIIWENNCVNLHFLAQTRLDSKQTGAAKEAIVQAISYPNAGLAVWLTYANILFEGKEYKEVVTVANTILERAPGMERALLIKAAALEQLGQTDQGAQELGKIVPTTTAMVAAQAISRANQGQNQAALDQINEALAASPNDLQLIRAAAHVYVRMEQKGQAQQMVAEALAREPENFELKLLRLQVSDEPTEERLRQYTVLVQGIDDEYQRALRMANIYQSEGEVDKQFEQLGIAKELIVKKATKEARQAGENTLRGLVDQMFGIALDKGDLAGLDALVKQAGELNLDAVDGLTYRGRRHMVAGYMASQKALAASQANRTQEAQGFQEESKQRYSDAIESLKEAIKKYPTSGETHGQLGEAYLQTDRLDEARIAFERANQLIPKKGMVLKRLALIALSTGNTKAYEDWLALCKEVIPDDPWVAERLLIKDESADPRQGIAKREKHRQANPEDASNLQKLAELYQQIGDNAKAEERINDLIALKDSANYIETIAALLRSIKQEERAQKMLEKNVLDAPADKKAEAQLLVGAHFAALRLRQADGAYLAAADIDPNLMVCTQIGRYFLMTNRPEQADEWLGKAQGLADENHVAHKMQIMQWRIDALLRMEKIADARALCDAYLAEFRDDPSGFFLDSGVEARRGNIDKAVEKLTLFLEKVPRHESGLYRRAQYLASMGKWQQAVGDLVDLRAANPAALDYQPRILLSKAYAQTGRLDMAFQELQSTYAENPDATAVVAELIDLYMAHSRYDDVDTLLTTILNKNPDNVGWLLRSADVLDVADEGAVAANLKQKAMNNLRRAAELTNYDPSVTTKLLRAYYKVKDVEQGIQLFETRIPANRQTPGVMLAYARLLAARGDLAASARVYQVALASGGYESFDFVRQVASMAWQTLGNKAAIPLFETPPTDQRVARANRHILSLLYQASEQFDEAMTICRSLLDTAIEGPEKVATLLRMGIAYTELRKDYDGAKGLYEQALAIEPDNLIALNNLAFLLTDQLNQPELAIPYALRAAKISRTPAIVDTLGWAYLRQGRYRDAIAQLTMARQENTTYTPVSYHLGEAYRREGQFDNAIELFNEVLRTPPGGMYDEYRQLAQASLDKAQSRSSE